MMLNLTPLRQKGVSALDSSSVSIAIGMGTCGIGNGADLLYQAFEAQIQERKLAIHLGKVGCFGFCAEEPLVNIHLEGLPLLILNRVKVSDIPKIFTWIEKKSFPANRVLCKVSSWDHLTGTTSYGTGFPSIREWDELPFFHRQKKIVLRDAGLINPESIEEFRNVGGYDAFLKVLHSYSPQQVIAEIKDSKLRGRGGAGFPTGLKWELMAKQAAPRKFLICNVDEGDPGAYMNRNEMESDPHMLIEGMLIGAYAMGAAEGIVYVRAEYPLAVQRLNIAVAQAQAASMLGNGIDGTDFNFDLKVVEGAGAFVCGEETALIASIEGKGGRPRIKPPFPAQSGYLGFPTDINNMETWCNIAAIIAKGSSWFKETGTEKSPGTKVFSLVGKIKNTGLVELPLGEKLTTLIYEIGGGAADPDKKIKAVQSGGPSGGCIPVGKFDTPIDYESLVSLGSIMGSGGMVVMDQDNCMVDVARYFIEFTHNESCGKCVPCREGLAQELALLDKIATGKGTLNDMLLLEELAHSICDSALCGLGQSAPNPVLTTLRYFKNEYEQHINLQYCEAGTCEELVTALCSNSCPLHMHIPSYLQLLKENRLQEAFEITLRDNPLPGTIGRICHFHCQMRCRRDTIDEPVHQGEIHRYLADTIYKMGGESQVYAKLVREKLPPTDQHVAIVGSGPAGLCAAFYLSRLGHTVTIYEREAKAGGILRYGIPSYRLPKEILDKELQVFKKLGIHFVFKKRLGVDFSLSDLKEQNQAVLLALGSYRSQKLDIPGMSLKGVVQGTTLLEDLAKQKKIPVGKKVVIIGGGNVAIDAARSLWRLGREVTVVYRRSVDDMPANRMELAEAFQEKINFVCMAGPSRILGQAGKRVAGLEIKEMQGGDYDLSGRKRPLESDIVSAIACDMVVIAIGESVEQELLQQQGLETTERGSLAVAPYSYRTNLSNVYAVGDVTTGPSTAAQAMGYAKKAAMAIDFALTSKHRFSSLDQDFAINDVIPEHAESVKPVVPRHLTVRERKGNFEEINKGYMGEQAHLEASRCLRCDIRQEWESSK
ncbi:NADH:ubiquinone oxidoreductase, NADH-binding (51 kD) subunit [Sphaerochaeta pleomorpha str. Grapes]|uniref:NADH:ubiquinone oxidoreductase, NADH-binding (51 kD) subunit n=1 Tax=Sphaerochaeta pleomorpha (strain ATCC BAA-1885 / DSM 22778 / Grapes) TaxID=158190 RepID=G8QU92_SPHPG|nr:FAD-dependent oxidoreductase [Sphaerochaeta pleomorpha]AEV28062.1 NADH:ubiquinone oxidoreductase, NADH-binding (51 kD) subunit [Sphaerochaeta pleomorpha str. Grapes]